ncbi:MAG TPA: S8 family serine peptidase [Oligoflexus sp.]|uniref:S8 family serine peptidase n=1 Tax=Oligoflexus sp. TaxID=1971216 RepID=UPI002D6B09CA|nr:S8 family serine peptidase [Oligoflexus sp.]HYX34626.1 S8 family serine peptidase [Oligoflexus sp.]
MYSKIFALLSLGVVSSWAWAAGSAKTHILPLVPNDTYFTSQWNLHNEGPGLTPMGKARVQGNDHAHIGEAWGLLRDLGVVKNVRDIGKTIRLAVIDDGFDLQHEDLKDKFVATKNFGGPVKFNNLFSIAPNNFHGTLVSGLAAASGDNGKGIIGACPGCRIVAARMGGDKPTGSIEDYYEKIFDWVLAQNADVINCSWGPDPSMSPGFAKHLVDRLAREGRKGKGTVVVFASGNTGQDFTWNHFASYPGALTVGASNSLGMRHSFSNFGPNLDLLAPTSGGKGTPTQYIDPIWTTDNYVAPDCLLPGGAPTPACSDQAGWTPFSNMAGGDNWEGRYSNRFSHTSSAAPLVSGVVALVMQANPNLTAGEVQSILQQTADRIAPKDARYDNRGFSMLYGYGRINALRAVAVAYEMGGKSLDDSTRARIDHTSPCTRKNCWDWPLK